MSYREPIAEIVDSTKQGSVLRNVIKLDSTQPSPLAPGSLHSLSENTALVIELHKVAERSQNLITFETYDSEAKPLHIGDTYIFRSWWCPDQLALAQDDSRQWQSKRFTPGEGDHEHCELCFKRISVYEDEENIGYNSGSLWLCESCYKKYIVSGFGKKLGDAA